MSRAKFAEIVAVLDKGIAVCFTLSVLFSKSLGNIYSLE